MTEKGICGRVRGIDRSLRDFDLFTGGGGRSPPESKGVRDGRSLEKATVRRESRNSWRKMKGEVPPKRPLSYSVVLNFSHQVDHLLSVCPFSLPSQLLLPQHLILDAL